MDDLVEIWETPSAKEMYMIAGWRQWADAGSVSSGLPQYLIEQTKAKKIAAIKPADFYLFQIPGAHHLLRPEVKLEQGYRVELRESRNEIFYAGGDQDKGLFIFLGDEPHLNADRYAEAFLHAVKSLGVKRVAAVGGVYGPMPYDKDREVSCVYSLPGMKDELGRYAVRFSDYEGGSTIGTYLVDKAETREAEFLVFYAFVPSYDFGQVSDLVQGVRVENDYKAWYDLMRRFNHMFDFKVDLSELERRSDELVAVMDDKIDELAQEIPQLNVRDYIERLATDFTERPFMPLGDVWKRALDDLFDDAEE